MSSTLNMRKAVGTCDIVLITLDTLRFDVAQSVWQAGATPNLAALLPKEGWEKRHAPGSFTYASHHAIFSGFLPTPCAPGPHPRLFAMAFAGSETVGPETLVLDNSTIMGGLKEQGYHSVCIGGTGFFNQNTPLGRVLPGLFAESHWNESLGVACKESSEHQFRLASERLAAVPEAERAFLFINIAAMHQPNYFYVEGRSREQGDDLHSHGAALAYVDSQLPILLAALQKRGPSVVILCSDHGTAYGEGGYTGHRLAHEVVWTVPYAHTLLPAKSQLL